MLERTFLMVKPDGVQRELVGDIISKLEKKGLKIVALKMLKISKELAELHYIEHREKPFFKDLVKFITSSPVVAMVLEGENVIDIVRKLAGKTNPKDAMPGTIRGDFALDLSQNVVHTSDSKESAVREINNFFNEEEIVEYDLEVGPWIS